MTKNPSNPNPEVQRVLFHCLLKGDPVIATPGRWDLYDQCEVSRYQFLNGATKETHTAMLQDTFPRMAAEYPGDYIMVAISASHPAISRLPEGGKDAGEAIDSALCKQYGFNQHNDYSAYKIREKKLHGSGFLIDANTPANEYVVLMNKNTYRALAVRILGNLAENRMENPGRAEIETIARNVDLTRGMFLALMRKATKHENYELAAIFRDMAKARSSRMEAILEQRTVGGSGLTVY